MKTNLKMTLSQLSVNPYLIKPTNIQPLTAAHSSSVVLARVSAGSSKGLGKLLVEPVSLARRSKRLEGVHRQYVVAELFPSISDTENDGVEFCWRDEA